MKVVILAGGFGTRLAEYTHEVPKPMVPIGNIPILVHIMGLYARFGLDDFIVLTGYKSEIINEYFSSESEEKIYEKENINKYKYKIQIKNFISNIRVSLIYTGKNTMTGGRLKQAKKFIADDRFLLTYGDGISDVNIDNLRKFHQSHNKIASLTAVRPPVRFGELQLEGDSVIEFKEKPRMQKGWINGGFFVFERKIFDFIEGDRIMLEREPLEKIVGLNQLKAFKHDAFWQCMDTKRDKDALEKMWMVNQIPWIK